MEKSLYDQLQEIYHNHQPYYPNHSYMKKESIFDLYNDNKIAENFIKEYFKLGGKNNFILEKINRSIHIISTYFMGVFVSEQTGLHDSVLGYFKRFKSLGKSMDFDNIFSYFWYLLSLYHDQGYYYEVEGKAPCKYNGFKKYLYKKSCIFSDISYQYTINSNRYSLDTYEKYKLYRYIKMNKKIDHGIYGGHILFDRAIANLQRKYNQERKYNSNIDPKNFFSDELHWSIEHIDLFRMLSFMIMEHNIWTISDKKTAKECGLDKLTKNNYRKICPYNEPLLFLLCLVDTIEPYKKFISNNKDESIDFEEFSKNISFHVDKSSIEMVASVKIAPLFTNIYNKIKDTEDFMLVKVDHKAMSFKISW